MVCGVATVMASILTVFKVFLMVGLCSTRHILDQTLHPGITVQKSDLLQITCHVPPITNLESVNRIDLIFYPQSAAQEIVLVYVVPDKINRTNVSPKAVIHGHVSPSRPKQCHLNASIPLNDDSIYGKYSCVINHGDDGENYERMNITVSGDHVQHEIQDNEGYFMVKIEPVHEIYLTWTRTPGLDVERVTIERSFTEPSGSETAPVTLWQFAENSSARDINAVCHYPDIRSSSGLCISSVAEHISKVNVSVSLYVAIDHCCSTLKYAGRVWQANGTTANVAFVTITANTTRNVSVPSCASLSSSSQAVPSTPPLHSEYMSCCIACFEGRPMHIFIIIACVTFATLVILLIALIMTCIKYKRLQSKNTVMNGKDSGRMSWHRLSVCRETDTRDRETDTRDRETDTRDKETTPLLMHKKQTANIQLSPFDVPLTLHTDHYSLEQSEYKTSDRIQSVILPAKTLALKLRMTPNRQSIDISCPKIVSLRSSTGSKSTNTQSVNFDIPPFTVPLTSSSEFTGGLDLAVELPTIPMTFDLSPCLNPQATQISSVYTAPVAPDTTISNHSAVFGNECNPQTTLFQVSSVSQFSADQTVNPSNRSEMQPSITNTESDIAVSQNRIKIPEADISFRLASQISECVGDTVPVQLQTFMAQPVLSPPSETAETGVQLSENVPKYIRHVSTPVNDAEEIADNEEETGMGKQLAFQEEVTSSVPPEPGREDETNEVGGKLKQPTSFLEEVQFDPSQDLANSTNLQIRPKVPK